jgi:hypothetical protein
MSRPDTNTSPEHPLSVFYLIIEEVQIDLLLDLAKDMIARNSLLKVKPLEKQLRPNIRLMTHYGKLRKYCVCHSYTEDI